MRKLFKNMLFVLCGVLSICFVACGKSETKTAEKVTFAKTVLSEVEFENSDKVKIKQDEDMVTVSGEIEAMSDAQKSAFGVDGVTHVIVIKIVFDDERTIDSFEIKGNVTKVYSTDKTDDNYVGSLSDLLDNKSSEDAYCNLILSANTKEYSLTCKYSDSTTSTIKLKIDANLVTAVAE